MECSIVPKGNQHEIGQMMQLYNNEYENGVSKQMSLINESGTKMPLYFTHQNFYIKMNNYLKAYKTTNGTYPSTEDYRKKALEVLATL